jgi:hypothetical protein
MVKLEICTNNIGVTRNFGKGLLGIALTFWRRVDNFCQSCNSCFDLYQFIYKFNNSTNEADKIPGLSLTPGVEQNEKSG